MSATSSPPLPSVLNAYFTIALLGVCKTAEIRAWPVVDVVNNRPIEDETVVGASCCSFRPTKLVL